MLQDGETISPYDITTFEESSKCKIKGGSEASGPNHIRVFKKSSEHKIKRGLIPTPALL